MSLDSDSERTCQTPGPTLRDGSGRAAAKPPASLSVGPENAELDLPKRLLAWDIGGANLKTAHSDGPVLSVPFPLWREPDRLAAELLATAERMPPADAWLITMTGELCDCFKSKQEGVNRILDAAQAAAGNCPLLVWQTSGHFASVQEARQRPLETAAANWMALAEWVARSFAQDQTGLLIDIGSTTSDLILLTRGKPVPIGRTDTTRLESQELIYTGVSRTPLCAVTQQLVFRGREISTAAEFFATTADAYVLLGSLPECPADLDTADGKPRDRQHCAARILRMICADLESHTVSDACELALQFHRAQLRVLAGAVKKIARRSEAELEFVFLSGSGEFLGRVLASAIEPEVRRISCTETLSAEISCSACAWSLLQLAVL